MFSFFQRKHKNEERNYDELLSKIDIKIKKVRKEIDEEIIKQKTFTSNFHFYTLTCYLTYLICTYYLYEVYIALIPIALLLPMLVNRKKQKDIKDLEEKHKQYFEEMLNKTKFNDLKKIVERYESPQAKKERLLSEQEILLQAQNPQVLKNEFQVNPFLNKPTQQMVPTPTQLRHMNNLAPNLPTKPGAVSVQPIPNQQFLDVTSSPHQLVPASPTPRGWMDKMMDTIIGDDQFNKYALICQSCFTHNGLCLPEEFQNTKFKCYKCNFLNIRGDGNFPVKSMTNSPSINSIVDTDTESHIQDSLQTSLLDSINDNDNQVLSEPQQKVDQVSTPNILIQNATVVEEITVTQISKEILVEINQLEQVDEGKENSTLESTNSSIPHHRHHQESDEDLVMVSNEVEEK